MQKKNDLEYLLESKTLSYLKKEHFCLLMLLGCYSVTSVKLNPVSMQVPEYLNIKQSTVTWLIAL